MDVLDQPSWARRLGALIALLCVVAGPTAAAQGLDSSLRDQLAQQVAARAGGATAPVALEGAVDPDAYIVGPGDVFTVTAGGGIPIVQSATVSADGLLVFPDLGAFEVEGATLASVQDDVQAALRRAYRNVPTNVALSRPRQFFVHVSGAVPAPGRHIVGPVARVEDAIAASFNGQSPLAARNQGGPREVETPVPAPANLTAELATAPIQDERRANPTPGAPEESLPALRNVLVVHKDGARSRVDLMRYYATGDTRHNPYLRDGDAVHLPLFAPNVAGVHVDGDLIESQVHDYRTGDTVRDLAEVALGLGALDQVQAIRLTQLDSQGRPETVTLDATVLQADGLSPEVQPRAQVYFVSQDVTAGTADAVGALLYPGTYPIRIGQTSVQDLLAMAGGLHPEAMPRLAVLERRQETDPAMSYTVEETARLGTLDFFSLDFLASGLYEFQRIPLGAEVLVEGATPLLLRDGDRLLVPTGDDAIQVLGAVRRPGYVPFVAGAAASYYVEQAGGSAAEAQGVFVLNASTGEVVPASASTIQPGDRVFVDREPRLETEQQQQLAIQLEQLDRQESRDRRSFALQVVQTTLTAVSTVITLVLLLNDSGN
ncbi:MAG: polysaccharide biosynthesis/export family protein [Bacteroidota bacterium]